MAARSRLVNVKTTMPSGAKSDHRMPGRGRLVHRSYTPEEETTIRRGAADLGLADAGAFATLGDATLDVYLNDNAYWRNIPTEVWSFTIGGYQVIKKWLSYRERDLLGRPLTAEEATEVTNMARRLTALRLLQPALDANDQRVKAATYSWPTSLPNLSQRGATSISHDVKSGSATPTPRAS
jgi:hypothetical protein